MKQVYQFLILFPLTIICSKAFSQQDAQFSQYMFNSLFYNPSFAGVEGVTKITAIHRTQWFGFSTTFDGSGGNPTTQVLSLSTPIFKISSGVGLHVVNDNLGPQNNLEIQLSYAYHYNLNNSKISIGARFGIFSQSLDFDQYRPIQNDDPLLINRSGKESQVRPDVAAGIFYKAERYYLGASINHLLKSEFDFGLAEQRNVLENNFTFTGGFDYQLGFNFVLTPTALIKTDFNSYSFDIGAIGTYNNKMWGGIQFRQSEAAILMLGYSFLDDNSLKFGYSIDYIVKDRDAKQPTSHEIMVTYSLPVSKEPRKVIRTPRFRH